MALLGNIEKTPAETIRTFVTDLYGEEMNANAFIFLGEID